MSSNAKKKVETKKTVIAPRGLTPVKGTKADNTAKEVAAQNIAASTSEFTIEEGIEVPARQKGGVGVSRYPFDKLNEGNSFFVPSDVDSALYANDTEGKNAIAEDLKTIANRLSGATRRFKRTHPEFKFAIRQSVAPAGVRVWRVGAN